MIYVFQTNIHLQSRKRVVGRKKNKEKSHHTICLTTLTSPLIYSPFANHDTQIHGGRLEKAQAFHSPSTMGMLNYLVAGTSV
jgi:hypothetical protein